MPCLCLYVYMCYVRMYSALYVYIRGMARTHYTLTHSDYRSFSHTVTLTLPSTHTQCLFLTQTHKSHSHSLSRLYQGKNSSKLILPS
jgi:hypothetical protein